MTASSGGGESPGIDAGAALREIAGILPDERIWVGGHNTKLRALIDRELLGHPRPPIGPVEAAFLTPATLDEAVYFARKLKARIAAQGKLVVFVPAAPSTTMPGFGGTERELIERIERDGLRQVSESTCTDYFHYQVIQFSAGHMM